MNNLSVDDLHLIRFEKFADERGGLVALTSNRNIPFQIARVFYTFQTLGETVRGSHAHKTCQQILICISGSLVVEVDDGIDKREFLLAEPNIGLLVPALIWSSQKKYSPEAVCLVLASEIYDPLEYIHEYAEYLQYRRT